jgi:hypothetical protein
MSSLVLQFNGAAVELLHGITRLRVKTMKRGGVEYLALRPSYRVSGKNMQARTAKAESGATLVEIPASFIKDLKYPRPELGTSFLFHNDGYGWFTLRDLPDDAAESTPTLIVADSALMKTATLSDAKAEEPAKEPKQAKADKLPKPDKLPKAAKADKPKAERKGKSKQVEAQPEAPTEPTNAQPETNAGATGGVTTEQPSATAGEAQDTSSAEALMQHFGAESNGEQATGETTNAPAGDAQVEGQTPAAAAEAKNTTAAVKKASTSKKGQDKKEAQA